MVLRDPAALLSPAHFTFLAVFFVSGFAALLYQVIWQRMLGFFGGADVYAVTIVVSAFMGGLGFGSLAGGHLADRLSGRGRLLAFVGCELAVAIFAMFSGLVYYDWLYSQLGSWQMSRLVMSLLIFAVTLWPTFFMGMSLPLLTTAMTQDARQPARWVPLLYGWNTLGAACGSFMAVGVLFRMVDLVTAARLGAALSVACALATLAALRLAIRSAPPAEPSATSVSSAIARPPATGPSRVLGFRAWLAVYALSGFIALSLEIVWFRILGVTLKSNAFTFGHLLAVYLAGIGLGSLLGNLPFMRSRQPARAFFLLQAAIPSLAVVLLGLFVFLVHRLDAAGPLWHYLGRYETLSNEEIAQSGRGLFLTLYVLVPLVLLGPPTLLMGLSFGHLQRAVQTDLERLGRRVGSLQTANILGSMAGAILTGLVLLETVGSSGTLRLLVACSSLFGLLFVQGLPSRRLWPRRMAVVALTGLIAVLTPSPATLWATLHGTSADRVIYAEDGSGVAVLKTTPSRAGTVMHANGLGQSVLPYGGLHTVLGALPVMIHPAPVTIAVIGLGSGDTLFGFGGRPETERIDSIEILAAELAALRHYDRSQPYPALRMLLADPRVRHQLTDGRMLLSRATQKYDLIEADALRPTSAYAGNLYSVEYFELVRSRLEKGGLAVTWTPTERVINGFVRVFPYVLLFGESLAIGSESPIPFDRAQVDRRMQHAFTRDYYRRGGIDMDALLNGFLSEEPKSFGPGFDRRGLEDVNRDLFPKDEFAIPPRG